MSSSFFRPASSSLLLKKRKERREAKKQVRARQRSLEEWQLREKGRYPMAFLKAGRSSLPSVAHSLKVEYRDLTSTLSTACAHAHEGQQQLTTKPTKTGYLIFSK